MQIHLDAQVRFDLVFIPTNMVSQEYKSLCLARICWRALLENEKKTKTFITPRLVMQWRIQRGSQSQLGAYAL